MDNSSTGSAPIPDSTTLAEPVPTCGNCYTTYGCGWACQYVQVCGEDLDGCSHPSDKVAEFSEDFDGEQQCSAFECDPVAMLKRAYDYIDRLERQRQDLRNLHEVVGFALDYPAAEGVDHEKRVREAWNGAKQ